MLAVGLISGTSVDGIDAALVEITEQDEKLQARLIAGHTFNYDPNLRAEILAVCAGEPRAIAQFCELDDRIAAAFAQAAIAIIEQNPQPSDSLADASRRKPNFIGSHGQTVFHRPPLGIEASGKTTLGYSVQLGRGAVIAELTGIKTISDFRVADIERGGHAAPLVPMLDWLLLTHATQNRACQNIGGISNVCYLPASGAQDLVFGFDNAPGNVLIDMATQKLFNLPFDDSGQLASQGNFYLPLIESWLQQEFFHTPPPKSTGRELFSPSYLEQCLEQCQQAQLSNYDILATLTEFTARAIALSYRQFLPKFPDRVLLCGGGCRNRYLVERLRDLLAPAEVMSTDDAGVNADFKEAIAFAVLGYLKLQKRLGNLPSVTGAKGSVELGRVYG
ncbi:anhydro-N-acetylmuramic acid kinase [Tumidithrix helvetica PCC 7403]